MAENHEIGARGDLGVGAQRLAAHLGSQAASALGDGVGAEHRTTPPARQRAGHVPAADQAYLHEVSKLAGMIATTRP